MDQSQFLLNLNQLKAFARQDGFFLALLWTASMMSMLWLPQTAWGSLLMLSTPFFVAWRLIVFRRVLGGAISFRRAWAYTAYTFACASLVFALVQFLYFRFLDHGLFMQLMKEAASNFAPLYAEQGINPDELKASLESAEEMTPLNMTFLFFTYNIIIGMIVSPLIAIVCQRRRR